MKFIFFLISTFFSISFCDLLHSWMFDESNVLDWQSEFRFFGRAKVENEFLWLFDENDFLLTNPVVPTVIETTPNKNKQSLQNYCIQVCFKINHLNLKDGFENDFQLFSSQKILQSQKTIFR